jgi:hypothetical protein
MIVLRELGLAASVDAQHSSALAALEGQPSERDSPESVLLWTQQQLASTRRNQWQPLLFKLQHNAQAASGYFSDTAPGCESARRGPERGSSSPEQ